MSSGRITDALQSLLEWLTKAEAYLFQDQPILGDLDTVSILIEKHKLFQQEVLSRKSMVYAMLSSARDSVSLDDDNFMIPNENQIIFDESNQSENSFDRTSQMEHLQQLWKRVKELSDVREKKLQESLTLAENFNDAIQVVRDWLPDAEAELKFHSIPDDEDSIMQIIENHEKFQEELNGQQANIDKIRNLAEEILSSCHVNAVRFVKYYLTITQTRWEQAVSRSNQRSDKLHEALKISRNNASLLDELMFWLNDGHALLIAKEKDEIPHELIVVEELNKEHTDFHEDLISRSKDIERIVKSFSAAGNNQNLISHGQLHAKKLGRRGQTLKPSNEAESLNMRATMLHNKWKTVLKMSLDKKKKLQETLSGILELENCRNFDFDVWRQRYINWNRANKLKFMDFFRRQDRHGTGLLTRKEFIDGILSSKFPTNETELIVVFNTFDIKRLGRIQYKTFVDAIMKPDRQIIHMKPELKPAQDMILIDREIEDRLSHCQCRNIFQAQKVDEGKYKFGEKERICTVRVMNGSVFVRFGSGWMPLEEFIENNDPCKMKLRPAHSQRAVLRNASAYGSVTNLVEKGSLSNLSNINKTSNLTPFNKYQNNDMIKSQTLNRKVIKKYPIFTNDSCESESPKFDNYENNNEENNFEFSKSCGNLATKNLDNIRLKNNKKQVMGLSLANTGHRRKASGGSNSSFISPSNNPQYTTGNRSNNQGKINLVNQPARSSSSTSTWPRILTRPPNSASNQQLTHSVNTSGNTQVSRSGQDTPNGSNKSRETSPFSQTRRPSSSNRRTSQTSLSQQTTPTTQKSLFRSFAATSNSKSPQRYNQASYQNNINSSYNESQSNLLKPLSTHFTTASQQIKTQLDKDCIYNIKPSGKLYNNKSSKNPLITSGQAIKKFNNTEYIEDADILNTEQELYAIAKNEQLDALRNEVLYNKNIDHKKFSKINESYNPESNYSSVYNNNNLREGSPSRSIEKINGNLLKTLGANQTSPNNRRKQSPSLGGFPASGSINKINEGNNKYHFSSSNTLNI